jgi:hypothetical protein
MAVAAAVAAAPTVKEKVGKARAKAKVAKEAKEAKTWLDKSGRILSGSLLKDLRPQPQAYTIYALRSAITPSLVHTYMHPRLSPSCAQRTCTHTKGTRAH